MTGTFSAFKMAQLFKAISDDDKISLQFGVDIKFAFNYKCKHWIGLQLVLIHYTVDNENLSGYAFKPLGFQPHVIKVSHAILISNIW